MRILVATSRVLFYFLLLLVAILIFDVIVFNLVPGFAGCYIKPFPKVECSGPAVNGFFFNLPFLFAMGFMILPMAAGAHWLGALLFFLFYGLAMLGLAYPVIRIVRWQQGRRADAASQKGPL